MHEWEFRRAVIRGSYPLMMLNTPTFSANWQHQSQAMCVRKFYG